MASKERKTNMARKRRPEAPAPAARSGVVYQDRDLSWLEFNRRVLHEAKDERIPLLERLKFLAIFSSNLDEFFMKRIELLKRRAENGGAGEEELLRDIRERVLCMVREQGETFAALVSELKGHGVWLTDWDELTAEQQEEGRAYFLANVLAVLIPLAYDPAHPFPVSLESLDLSGSDSPSRDRYALFRADQGAQPAAVVGGSADQGSGAVGCVRPSLRHP